MTSHDAELSRNMDRITQLQDGIDNLVTIMYSTLSFLSRKADFKQVNPDIPITQTIPDPANTQPPREAFSQNCEELVQDFIRKAKQIEFLISILPPHVDPTQPHSCNSPASQNPQGPSSSSPSFASPPDNHNSQLSSCVPLDSEHKIPKSEIGDTKPPGAHESDGHCTANPISEDDSDREEFDRLQADIRAAQREYDQAVFIAESLHSEIKSALAKILNHRADLLSSIK